MNLIKMKLHVEAVRNLESVISSKQLNDLIKAELKSRDNLTINAPLRDIDSIELKENIKSIQICELESDGVQDNRANGEDCERVQFKDVKLSIHVYRLFQGGSKADLTESGSSDEVAATYWTLPTKEFHGLWESLIFDSDIKERLLRYALTMAEYSIKNVNPVTISCNRIILAHGPPGTGKTTLCKAVSQKLSIRLSPYYKHTVLIEINAHSLFSKYFSESGKLVSKMFSKLSELVEDGLTLVCVLIDEVESLTHSRQAASASSEPSDAVRVVNAVLTQLDRLKQYPNVMIFSTSNISGVVDGAFVDRADISFFVPNPSLFAIYTIYYSCIEELIRVGMVVGPLPHQIRDKHEYLRAKSESTDPAYLALYKLTELSLGMSGRMLRKLPVLAHSYHLPLGEVTPLLTFLQAMTAVVTELNSTSTSVNQD